MSNILITGCSKGIGKQLVLNCLKDPNNKVIAISRNVEIEKSQFWSFDFKTQLLAIAFDITQIENNEHELIQRIGGWCESIDILINNAGLLINKPFENFSISEIMEQIETNWIAPSLLIKALLPFLKKADRAHIVNIGSMGGFQGSIKFKGLSWYSASKAALACMSECLAEELQSYNIFVNCLALGAVDTEMLQAAFPEFKAPVSDQQMAEFIMHFAIEGHYFFNGKILPVALNNP